MNTPLLQYASSGEAQIILIPLRPSKRPVKQLRWMLNGS